MKYEFTDEYITGIRFIDEEHEKLFEITNRAYDLLMDQFRSDKYDAIVGVLEEMREYTRTHFEHEDLYMKKIDYPKRFSELHQHKQFIAKLDAYDLKHMDNNQHESLMQLIEFLAAWLTGHIKGMDKKIPYVAEVEAEMEKLINA